jgi:TPR repeat protein
VATEACIAAAHQGRAEDQFRLGVMYCTGEGVEQDLVAATFWYQRAAEQGHRYAQHNIAVMLSNGQGTRQDQAAAFQWSMKAAEQGVPEAQLMLGNLFAAGLGVVADPATARHWYGKAAAQGNATALTRLRALDKAGQSISPSAHPSKIQSSDPLPSVGAIAIITMVYNERINLPIWLRHYRRMAPSATLFVIDHSSDDGSTNNLSGVNVIPVPRDEHDERDRTFLINSLQQGLLRYYETVIYTDSDELLVPDPAKATTLEVYLRSRQYSYASPIGVNVIHMVADEPPLDLRRPLLLQRRYGQFHSHLCKPIVTRIPLTWEPGFHSCEKPFYIDLHLYLFHIKQIDKDLALQRQQLVRRLSWSKRAIEAKHSAHHRYDDENFVREFFHDPALVFQERGSQPFAFAAELARFQEEAREMFGTFHVAGFAGPIVEIPDNFRSSF